MAEKIALVTGASSGFGLLTSLELARRGFRVAATMRDLQRRARLQQAAAEAGAGERIHFYQLDVCDPASITAAVGQIAAEHGRIDVLVNNAGFAQAGFAEDLTLDELRRQFETNFFGAVAVTQAVLPHMRRQGAGHIIMVSSISGRVAPPVIGAYASSKWALEGWSESLRLETWALGIRVVVVEPGSFETDIWTRNAHIAARSLSGDSPNQERGRRFREHVQKDIRKRDPRPVARLIARIACDPNPRLRYLAGPDARFQVVLKALLPWKLYERLVRKATRIDG
jgi:NAD(P)-dependent dehydrogenase (short-subunit alcohol dehydrogenase family)